MATDQGVDRRVGWTPPPRPDWVARLNDEGRCMNIRGVVPLDADSLIDAAKAATGLSDFGEESWYEPFRVVTQSLEDDAELNLTGRIRTRSEILQLLEARLQIEETYKRHPEIEDEEITRPLIIIGQGRSGTTFLANVMGMHPDCGIIKAWEAALPCPPPEAATYLTDPRIARGHRLIDQANRVTPEMMSMHEFAGELHVNCSHVMAMTFRSRVWMDTFGQVSTYDAYLNTQDLSPAYRYHKRVLKLLQWKNPRKRWVLRDPTHADRLALCLETYPDACFIWTHRDPVRAFASIVNLIGITQWGRTDHPFKGGSFEFITDLEQAARRMNGITDKIAAGAIPESQLYNVAYRDLVGDTAGTLAKIYEYFGVDFGPRARSAIERYLAEHPRSSRPAHDYAKGTDAMITRERQAFERYRTYFAPYLEE